MHALSSTLLYSLQAILSKRSYCAEVKRLGAAIKKQCMKRPMPIADALDAAVPSAVRSRDLLSL